MSRPRFLADHDFRGPIIHGIQRAEPACGIERALDLGLAKSTDEEILDLAAREGLIVLSHDRNTMTAAAYARIKTGLPMKGRFIAKSERLFCRQVIDDIVLIWFSSEAEEWDGKVDYLPW